jgi:hypothetical protein
MNRQELSATVLAGVCGFVAMMATGQIGGFQWQDQLFVAQANRSIAPQVTDGGRGTTVDYSAPANILEDVPRRPGSEQVPRTLCDDDAAESKTPRQCRRWSEIAHTS